MMRDWLTLEPMVSVHRRRRSSWLQRVWAKLKGTR
jgi:hypothetical protein